MVYVDQSHLTRWPLYKTVEPNANTLGGGVGPGGLRPYLTSQVVQDAMNNETTAATASLMALDTL